MNEPNIPIHELEQLLEMLREARTRADERVKAAHERFNVFTTLLAAHDEVRLHTRFLHCLLDPKGSHDCGSLFLELFFATIKESPDVVYENKPIRFNVPPSEKQWSVDKEVSCPPHGQIDLLLLRTGYKIAIENKINAYEQQLQLACYSEYIQKRPTETTWLIYLTKDGKASTTHKGAPYIRISYAKHILEWLDKCLCNTYQIIPINQALLQYREVVRNITGNTIKSINMKPIAKFITENSDIICFRKYLDEGIKEACASFFESLADEIKKELHEFQVRPHPNEQRRFGVDPFGALIIKPPNNVVPFDICIENNTEDKALEVGISEEFDKQKLSTEQINLFSRMYEKLKANGCDQNNITTNWPTGWSNLIDGLDDDGMAKLLKAGPVKTASKVCDKIRSHITLLERIYTEVNQPTNTQT